MIVSNNSNLNVKNTNNNILTISVVFTIFADFSESWGEAFCERWHKRWIPSWWHRSRRHLKDLGSLMATTLSWWCWSTRIRMTSSSFWISRPRWTEGRFQWRICPHWQTWRRSKRYLILWLTCVALCPPGLLPGYCSHNICFILKSGLDSLVTLFSVYDSCTKSPHRRTGLEHCWMRLYAEWLPKM